MPDYVVEFSLIVADPRTHLGLKGLHGENLNANVYVVSDKEGQMLNKQILCNERVFPELGVYSVEMISGKTSVSS